MTSRLHSPCEQWAVPEACLVRHDKLQSLHWLCWDGGPSCELQRDQKSRPGDLAQPPTTTSWEILGNFVYRRAKHKKLSRGEALCDVLVTVQMLLNSPGSCSRRKPLLGCTSQPGNPTQNGHYFAGFMVHGNHGHMLSTWTKFGGWGSWKTCTLDDLVPIHYNFWGLLRVLLWKYIPRYKHTIHAIVFFFSTS